MDSRNGVWQCTRVVVRYCAHSVGPPPAPARTHCRTHRTRGLTARLPAALQYASRGAKEFANELVPALKSEFPHVDLVVETKRGHAPFIEGFYKNGRSKPIGVKGEAPEQIHNLAKLLIQQWGGKNVLHSGKRVKTRSQSVQGL